VPCITEEANIQEDTFPSRIFSRAHNILSLLQFRGLK